jgi:hypothetical protein
VLFVPFLVLPHNTHPPLVVQDSIGAHLNLAVDHCRRAATIHRELRPLSPFSSIGVSLRPRDCPACTPWLGEPFREDIAHHCSAESNRRSHQVAIAHVLSCASVCSTPRSSRTGLAPQWAARGLVGSTMPRHAQHCGRAKQDGSRSDWAARVVPAHWPENQFKSFSIFIFNSIQVSIWKILIYLNICPKIMKLVLLGS